ncbi:hypothetical protein EG68_07024 [Paragonimus skrjabini miyazakii]|uniref:Uncharacterized protein n=1 Tax=Paragonimus skrjabini miyazakii TaxID=59628 RepID=A0A8S9YRJ2_9TREM|nr:hypothetical protein EG68_07024 [Paragonimus skrjabini miyazakii]
MSFSKGTRSAERGRSRQYNKAHCPANNFAVSRSGTDHSRHSSQPTKRLAVTTARFMKGEPTSVVAIKASVTQEWAQMQSEDPYFHPIYQRLPQGGSRSSEREVVGTDQETCCLWALLLNLVINENRLYFQDGPKYFRQTGTQIRSHNCPLSAAWS